MEVRVPGAVYYECFDPYCTDVPRESGWPEPKTRSVGKGRQMRYEVSREMAVDMIENAELFGQAISYGVDPETAVTGRMIVRWVERERERLGL